MKVFRDLDKSSLDGLLWMETRWSELKRDYEMKKWKLIIITAFKMFCFREE